jgi:hypothetical protein
MSGGKGRGMVVALKWPECQAWPRGYQGAAMEALGLLCILVMTLGELPARVDA